MGSMKALQTSSVLAVGNDYLEAQYESYLRDPDSVTEQWREYFDQLPMSEDSPKDIPHSDVRDHFYQLTRFSGQRRRGPEMDASYSHSLKQIHVTQLINAYRVRGHQLADIDPLGREIDARVREVKLEENNLSRADTDTIFDTSGVHGISDQAPLSAIIDHLDQCYCGSIGYEFMYVNHTPQKDWLIQRIESTASKPRLSDERRKWLLRQLTGAEGIEKFLHSKYVGQKRFSLEGGESLIIIMNELVRRSFKTGLKDMVVGMAHRGRLNVLINMLGKNPAELFSEFEGKKKVEMGSGDVKYHQGFSTDIEHKNGNLHLTLAFNPSHLEIVSPVVEGSVRSRQERYGDRSGDMVLPVSIHGDSAFAGQGVVMETFNMAESRGFSTKGTVHIIVNNQIGFTTSNSSDIRSTVYSSDVAKMINAPIFHVNGDDPEAVLFVTQLALDFRNQFKKDVVIDLVCYRRHGHNEADEPSVTQPMMYKIIKKLPTTRKIYAEKLTQSGVLTDGESNQFVEEYRAMLENGQSTVPNMVTTPGYMPDMAIDWDPYLNIDWDTPADTTTSLEDIRELSTKLTTMPEGFALHPRVAKIVDDRRKMAQGALPIDWGMAETLAYATLLKDGYPVRLSGQDSGRGTFFHRHAVVHNQHDGGSHVPLRELFADQPNFLVIDSVLSEEAVLAFEYGYASADPTSLVIWEAQFGDFANGAQVVMDQFISSGETKWGRMCGLVMLLPHGYEGQGPEHSSARLERYLQLCSENNMQVLVPSTPAQAFHMFRRQMIRPMRRPMVVMTPKSLLRHRLAVSTLEDLTEGTFQNVIDEIDDVDKSKIDRVVLCSGKVYYDILEKRRSDELNTVAIVRMEQLYPFPYDDMTAVLETYPNVKSVVWCQEEPRNQGAWRSNRHRIERLLNKGQALEYCGRDTSASPAVGSAGLHTQQQIALVQEALGLVEGRQLKY